MIIYFKVLDEEKIIIKPYLTSTSGELQDLYLQGFVYNLENFINVEDFDSENIVTMKLIDIVLKDL